MNRTRLRDNAARGALKVARKCGVQLSFTVPSATPSPVTVWGLITDNNSLTRLRDGSTDEYQITFVVPRQTNFPPAAGFKPGIYVTYGGFNWEIDSIKPDNEDVSQASTFELTCGRYGDTAEIGSDP